MCPRTYKADFKAWFVNKLIDSVPDSGPLTHLAHFEQNVLGVYSSYPVTELNG